MKLNAPVCVFAARLTLAAAALTSAGLAAQPIGDYVNSPAPQNTELRERLFDAENQRVFSSELFQEALNSGESLVIRQAALAVGRVGGDEAAALLKPLLANPEAEIAALAAFALGISDAADASTVITQHLQGSPEQEPESRPAVQAAAVRALGHFSDEASFTLLESTLQTTTDRLVQLASLKGFENRMISHPALPSAETIERLTALVEGSTEGQSEARVAAARILFRVGNSPDVQALVDTERLLAAGEATTDSWLRTYLLLSLSRLSSEQPCDAYLRWGSSFEGGPAPRPLKTASLFGLSFCPAGEQINAFLNAHTGSEWPGSVRINALSSLAKLAQTDHELPALLVDLTEDDSLWVASEALKRGMAFTPDAMRPKLQEVLQTPEHPLYVSSLATAGLNATAQEVEHLLGVVSSPESSWELKKEAFTGLRRVRNLDSDSTSRLVEPLRSALTSADVTLVGLALALVDKLELTELGPVIIEAYPELSGPAHLENRVSVTKTLASLEAEGAVDLLTAALEDPERKVAAAAAEALRALTGEDFSERVPFNSVVNDQTPALTMLDAVGGTEVVFETTRGDVVLTLRGDTPLTGMRFVELVIAGHYDGLNFHMILGNYWALGGDATKSGAEHPGELIRDELTPVSHEVGSVGMASNGKDTAFAPFFFNLTPNFNLDQHHTVFADITEGMEVVENLEQGDRILSARIRNPL